MTPKSIKRTLLTALNAAAGAGGNTRDRVFLNSISDTLETGYPGYEVAQKFSTGTEKLYDICIYKEKTPEPTLWPSSKAVISEVFAAIEVENRQGPVRAYEDLWKVIFSRATHRVFCGGIDDGGASRPAWERMIQKRFRAIEAFYGTALVSGMIVAFYPRPKNWAVGRIYPGFVSAHKYP
jgi:hypothetical protein